MKDTKHRYRPVFSAEEVEVLDTILKDRYLTESGLSNTTTYLSPPDRIVYAQLLAKVSTLKSKIANNAINPAYITTKHPDHKIAILESLGAPEDTIAIATGNETREQYWERCYLKFTANPISCTTDEIIAAHEHMYLNDLMSPEEVKRFEDSMNG